MRNDFSWEIKDRILLLKILTVITCLWRNLMGGISSIILCVVKITLKSFRNAYWQNPEGNRLTWAMKNCLKLPKTKYSSFI